MRAWKKAAREPRVARVVDILLCCCLHIPKSVRVENERKNERKNVPFLLFIFSYLPHLRSVRTRVFFFLVVEDVKIKIKGKRRCKKGYVSTIAIGQDTKLLANTFFSSEWFFGFCVEEQQYRTLDTFGLFLFRFLFEYHLARVMGKNKNSYNSSS